ncbi:stabilizer of axonemal microtubules 2-like [Lingula anatina]|uniref:Stabilizer of axonemal microtubules 2-like n=1 Tax=Lingula anatina TaxID=7574 RepID=A0A1S3IMG6_LINAN|nr:stabilizer of axonemal microtubules 2-like [Lingula anatina]|eukprot:XP_013399430.1 stabilizer of axonemal microtubules 2-like [Lingula anatina]
MSNMHMWVSISTLILSGMNPSVFFLTLFINSTNIFSRHRCPHNRENRSQQVVKAACVLTEYQLAFKQHDYQPPRESLRPKIRMYDSKRSPREMATTYTETYVPHEVNRRYVAPKKEYVPAQGEVNLHTTYEKEFTPKQGKRALPYKPKNERELEPPPFNSKTVYQTAYLEIDKDEAQKSRSKPMKHNECIVKSDEKFFAVSTVQDDYKQHEAVERRKPIKPAEREPEARDDKFVDVTTYKAEFIRKSPDPVVAKRPKDHKIAEDGKYNTISTVMADYQAHKTYKREASFKPPQEYVVSTALFDSRTTKSMAYKQWPIQPKEIKPWMKKPQYEPSSLVFTKTSSYQDDFTVPETLERVKPIRPVQNDLHYLGSGDSRAPFSCKTHYREEFLEWEKVLRPASYKVVNKYQPPEEKWHAESIMKSHYQGIYTPPAQICEPPKNNWADISPRARMLSTSIYGETFRGERPKSCPAKLLAKEMDSAYTYLREKRGHRFFAKNPSKSSVESSKSNKDVAPTAAGSEAEAVKTPKENEKPQTPRVETPRSPSHATQTLQVETPRRPTSTDSAQKSEEKVTNPPSSPKASAEPEK